MNWRNELRRRAKEWTAAQPIVFKGEIPPEELKKFKKFVDEQILCEATSPEGLACEGHRNHDGPHKDSRGNTWVQKCLESVGGWGVCTLEEGHEGEHEMLSPPLDVADYAARDALVPVEGMAVEVYSDESVWKYRGGAWVRFVARRSGGSDD